MFEIQLNFIFRKLIGRSSCVGDGGLLCFFLTDVCLIAGGSERTYICQIQVAGFGQQVQLIDGERDEIFKGVKSTLLGNLLNKLSFA